MQAAVDKQPSGMRREVCDKKDLWEERGHAAADEGN